MRLRGVVFDLDGTLRIPPTLNLQALQATVRRRSYASEEQKQRALEAVQRAKISSESALPGAAEVCNFIDSKNLRRGMITLSSRKDAEKLESELHTRCSFSPVIGEAMKPSPEPLLQICKEWGVEPAEVLMVGDSAKLDVACGKSAGARTCLVDPLYRYAMDQLSAQQRPDFQVHSLQELTALIQKMCTNKF